MRESERRLCVNVHGARAALPPAAFAAVLDIVNRQEVAEAGEGSAAAGRRLLAEMQSASTCGDEASAE
jgi:hypothetical protein